MKNTIKMNIHKFIIQWCFKIDTKCVDIEVKNVFRRLENVTYNICI